MKISYDVARCRRLLLAACAVSIMAVAGCTVSTGSPSSPPPAGSTTQPASATYNLPAGVKNKPPEQQFRMRIEEVRSIPGRGTLVTGPIEQGAVAAGDGVEIVGSGAKPIASVVTAVFVSGEVSERGHAGDTVGVLLRAVDRNQVTRGQVLRAS